MATLYILKGIKQDKFYIGSTNNFKRRLKQHKSGKSKYTKVILPVKLVFKQEYKITQSARKAEIWLKKQKDRKLIERIVKEGKLNKKF